MRPVVTRALAASIVLASCSGSASDAAGEEREVTGTIRYLDLEGGFWAIQADDGTLNRAPTIYDPTPDLDPAWHRPYLPVRARVDVLEGRGTFRAGKPVDLLELEPIACGPVPCPPPAPAVVVGVGGRNPATSRVDPVVGASIANVTGPGEGAAAFGCEDLPFGAQELRTSFCWIRASVPGSYEADVTAPGWATLHARFEVPARTTFDYECCPLPYEPLRTWVNLDPP